MFFEKLKEKINWPYRLLRLCGHDCQGKHALNKPLRWYGAKELAIARMAFVSVFITKERPRRLQPTENDSLHALHR